MEYSAILLVLAVFAGAIYLRWRWSRATSSDFEAIETYARSRNLRVIEVDQSGNHWRYWLRGKLLLSNVARIFIVTVEGVNGARSKLHVAFDPVSGSRGLKLLQEKQIEE